MGSLEGDRDTVQGFPFEIVPGSEPENRRQGDLWAQGVAAQKAFRWSLSSLASTRSLGAIGGFSERQLGPPPPPSLSLQPCPGFLWAQPQDLRLTLRPCRHPFLQHVSAHFRYMFRERVYSNYTEYHPLVCLRNILHLLRQILETGDEWKRIRYLFFFLNHPPAPPATVHTDISLRGQHSFQHPFMGPLLLEILG